MLALLVFKSKTFKTENLHRKVKHNFQASEKNHFLKCLEYIRGFINNIKEFCLQIRFY